MAAKKRRAAKKNGKTQTLNGEQARREVCGEESRKKSKSDIVAGGDAHAWFLRSRA